MNVLKRIDASKNQRQPTPANASKTSFAGSTSGRVGACSGLKVALSGAKQKLTRVLPAFTPAGLPKKFGPVKSRRVRALYLACHTEQEIAERTALSRETVSDRIAEFIKPNSGLLVKTFPGTKLPKLSQYQEKIAETAKLETFPNPQKLSALYQEVQ